MDLTSTHQKDISRRTFSKGQGTEEAKGTRGKVQKGEWAEEVKGRRADLTWYAGMLCTSPSQVRTCSSFPAVGLLLGKL